MRWQKQTYSVLLLLATTAWAESVDSNQSLCAEPYWKTPAQSTEGIFHGDLLLDCTLLRVDPSAVRLIQQGILDKIKAESTIHSGPHPSVIQTMPALGWDISHTLKEDGNQIQIREEAILGSDQHTKLIYQTYSKDVSASGMASYLRSVNFMMHLTQSNQSLKIVFANEVTVDRPWFALDLIFAPIARNICFEKMEQVKSKLLPWIQSLISSPDQAP